ncbi:MAG: DNA recombination/repair protein RecA, partial [bacterium]|nr:DNA recombination/repair protein RecA [bacterium]
QGKENVRLYLKEHPEIASVLEKQIRAELLEKKLPMLAADTPAEIFEGIDD